MAFAPPSRQTSAVAIVDVTSPDVATGPFRVVRAVSPDLQGLAYGYGMDRAVVSRIRAMGLSARDSPNSSYLVDNRIASFFWRSSRVC